jgi:poly(glycerol-phosphate) alpha-glucosyltransferase
MHRPPELEVSVYGLKDPATEEDLPSWEPVPVHAARVQGPRSFGFSAGLGSKVAQAGHDILHVHGLWMYPSVVAQRWSAHARAPYVVSPRGMLDAWALRNSDWKKRWAARAYERRHLQHAACVHALCEAELEAIRAFGLANPVCVIPNGARVAPAIPSSYVPSWRSALGNSAKVLLYLGRLHPKKGLKNLLLACALLQQTRGACPADWNVVIAGWDQDDHRAELERLVAELKLKNLVRFLGPQFGVDKDIALMAAQGFILPSLSEGLPMAVLEAWAHGLPVLMTRQCNLEEGFREGAALCVEPEPGSIAEGLRLFFDMSEDQRREIGRAGRHIVATRFDWTGIGTRMEEVYRWLLGVGPRPDCVRLGQ